MSLASEFATDDWKNVPQWLKPISAGEHVARLNPCPSFIDATRKLVAI
jgi:hypothetical protein